MLWFVWVVGSSEIVAYRLLMTYFIVSTYFIISHLGQEELKPYVDVCVNALCNEQNPWWST